MSSPIQKGEQKANREALRLETRLTHRKENPAPTSNREKEALFQAAVPTPPEPPPHHQITPDQLEKLKISPHIFVAIKNRPDPLFFFELHMNFSLTMSRLSQTKIETTAPPTVLPHKHIAVTKNGTPHPICYAANSGPPDFAWGKI